MTGEPILAFESVSKHYGTIVALELTNPALRKIRFTRVSQ